MVHFVDLGGNGKGADLSPRKAASKRRSFPNTIGLPSGSVVVPPASTDYIWFVPLFGRGF